MQIFASTPDEYVSQIPDERKDTINRLRSEIKKNIPEGFEETMSYGMIGYVVPHRIFPQGYHCDPKLPLPFMNIASQKNFIAVYHMGIYANPELLHWYLNEFSKLTKLKPDMGKGCIRFKKPEQIPFTLIGELASKITVPQWIELYQTSFTKKS